MNKEMSNKKAFAIALHCMQEGLKPYQFEAKMYEMFQSRTPAAISDHEHYAEIEEAIKIIFKIGNE